MLDNNLYLVDIQYQLALLQKEYNLPEEIRVMCDYDQFEMYYRVYISAPHVGVEISDSTKEIDGVFVNKLVETVRLLLKGGASNMAEKIVKYDEWCDKCVYFPCDPGNNDNPCNNCLNIPVNIDSKKPIFWKGDETKNKKGH